MSKEERQKFLWEMSDEDIDFSDLPEMDQDFLPTVKKITQPQKSKKRGRVGKTGINYVIP